MYLSTFSFSFSIFNLLSFIFYLLFFIFYFLFFIFELLFLTAILLISLEKIFFWFKIYFSNLFSSGRRIVEIDERTRYLSENCPINSTSDSGWLYQVRYVTLCYIAQFSAWLAELVYSDQIRSDQIKWSHDSRCGCFNLLN